MKPWDNMEFDYPNIPTMITPEETQYLYWLGAHFWRDTGHIVEIGPWLGGSTASLAAGMKNRPHCPTRKLHVFDNFVWQGFMADRASLPLSVGESFQPYFKKNIAPYSDLISTHRQALPDDEQPLDKMAESISAKEDGKIPALSWDTGELVEILFIDGAKSWTGLAYLLRTFRDFLLPGKSILVCQDYKFWGSYWVPMMFEYFAGHFETIHNLERNTVTFRLTGELSESDIDSLPGYRDLDVDSGIELLESASQRLLEMGDRLGALILQGCKVRYSLNMGSEESAVRLFRELEAKWPSRIENHTINRMRAWLEGETGANYAPTLQWRFGAAMEKAKHRTNRLVNRIL